MTPQREKAFLLLSSQQLPLSPSWTLKGLYELTLRPLRAISPPCTLRPQLQKNKDTIGCAWSGSKVPGHCQKQLTQTLIVENAFLHPSLVVKNQQNGIEL